MILLALSLFLAEPVPLDMPRAEAYIVSEDGTLCLEDRYDRLEQWISQSVVGRWTDDDGREFMLSRLDMEPPAVERDAAVTRVDYAAQRVPMPRIRANHSLPKAFTDAIEILSPCATAEIPRSPKQQLHGYRDVSYWQQPTNLSAIVCAFRREKEETWYLASWLLAAGDNYTERMQLFEDRFLGSEFAKLVKAGAGVGTEAKKDRKTREAPSERDLLRADARHSVSAYRNWHCSDGEEFVVLDCLKSRDFIGRMTNEFAAMRAKYAATLPTKIDGSNVLCVARIYSSREEYLDALETSGLTNMEWSAAYWSSARRELVAYLPSKGEDELLKTIRHEALHQYLSYAASMIPVSPWLNEGYAQYFEDVKDREWGDGVELTPETVDRFAESIPGVMAMGYGDFYGGTDVERRLKYRLAWSIAVFLENGADKVRFQPFRGLKSDYFATLFNTQDMLKATSAAIRSQENLKLFVDEWKKFWLGK